MNTRTVSLLGTSAFVVASVVTVGTRMVQNQRRAGQRRMASIDGNTLNKLIADFPPRPRVAALHMRAQYGVPQQATCEQLIWHNAGPFKRITVTRAEHHHDFPFPHMDYLEHTIEYCVPVEKAAALSAYDSSLTFDRTRGEMSARCDLEGHNILTLNLAHDLVTGNKDTEEARKVFSGQMVLEDWAGTHPPYVERLHFEPAQEPAAYPDAPTIPGAPKRAAALGSEVKKSGDGEILGFLVAADLNAILAATHASKKRLSSDVRRYTTMLHTEHGTNLHETLKVGRTIDVTPVVTTAVDKLLVKGARELAEVVPLDGEQFGAAYVNAMIKSHKEVLNVIDTKLLKEAENEAVQQHLKGTRGRVAMHLEEVRNMQPAMSR
jgi:predicted outer membrane protein